VGAFPFDILLELNPNSERTQLFILLNK